MGEQTSIGWTTHTFNPWWGCTKVSDGCDHCYAESFDKRVGGDHWGPGQPRRFFGPKHWKQPLDWNEEARRTWKIEKVFSGSMCDIFDTEPASLQQMNAARQQLWATIRLTDHLIWQLLTKRPAGYSNMIALDVLALPRVWPGVTCENQPQYELRWPKMPDFSARRPWISYEPALGPLTLTLFPWPSWVVCGGESGNQRRPMVLKWAADLKAECQEKNIPFFMKQVSARTPNEGKLLIPESLKAQEFPFGQ